MGLLLDIEQSISNAHKRIISDYIEINPGVALSTIAKQINELPEMMTCHTPITVNLLAQLGYSPPIVDAIADDATADEDAIIASDRLSIDILRKQLEFRHFTIQKRIEDIMQQETISGTQLKVIETFLKIDDNVISKLLELMGQESTPILPQAIIITCLRRLGVDEADIKLIELM